MSFFIFFILYLFLDKILRIGSFNQIVYIINVEWFEHINWNWNWAKN